MLYLPSLRKVLDSAGFSPELIPVVPVEPRYRVVPHFLGFRGVILVFGRRPGVLWRLGRFAGRGCRWPPSAILLLVVPPACFAAVDFLDALFGVVGEWVIPAAGGHLVADLPCALVDGEGLDLEAALEAEAAVEAGGGVVPEGLVGGVKFVFVPVFRGSLSAISAIIIAIAHL